MGFGADVGLSVINAGLDAAGSYFSAKSANAANKKMYKHRYQWQMADMRKAGLNPMLAFSQGAPQGPQMVGPDLRGIGDKATSTYMASKMNNASVANLEQNTGLAKANARLANATAIKQEYENWEKESTPEFQQVLQAHPYNAPVGTTAASETRFKAAMETVEANARKAIADADTAGLQRDLAKGELSLQEVRVKYADQLAKLQVAYNDAMKEAARLGIPHAKADAAFWSGSGELAKWASFISDVLGHNN